MMQSSSEPSPSSNVLVCVRVRPLQVGLSTELASPLPGAGDVAAWTWEDNTISQDKSVVRRMSTGPSAQEAPPVQYAFDHIFDPSVPTAVIFDQVARQVVLKALDGYHGAILAYGQTSSGKTFTMSGSESEGELGIIKLSVQACFAMVDQAQYADREFTFKASMLEVWNEQVRDLLSPSEGQEIKIQTHPTQGTVVTGNKEVVVSTFDQVSQLLARGEAARSIASTEMNEQSSRAHTLFRFVVESKQRGGGEDAPPARTATLNLVDLAGSENAKMTGSAGDRAREARHINQSLLTLSLIIQRLGEESGGSGSATRRQSAHMPYRDSKLTRLLEQSLDGSAHIVIICNISQSLKCCDETHNTLRFATRAKKIKIEARRNEVVDDKALLRLYRNEIEQLKARLDLLSRGLLGAAPSPLDPGPSDSLAAAPESHNNPTSAASQKSGSTFFFEIDESDDQETTLRMIGEMETLIKRVAQAARRESSRRSTPAAADVDAPLMQQRRRVSPGESEDEEDSCSSTESSPPYAPTWRDSIGFSPATPPFDVPDTPSASGGGGGNEGGDSREVGTGGWRHAFSHAGSFDSGSSSAGATTTQHPFQVDPCPDGSADVSRVATPVRAQQGVKQRTPDSASRGTDPARFGFQRRTSPNAGGAAVVEAENDGGGALSILTSQSMGSVGSNSNSSFTAEGTPILSALRSRADSLRDSLGQAQAGGRERTSSSTSVGSFDGGEKALTSVSLLLLQLKAQIRSSRRLPPAPAPAPVPALALTPAPAPPAPVPTASPGADSKEKELERLMDTLRLELRLKDADNKFLQAELEKKETLMDVLTEGLKEVEVAQETWLRNNEDLTVDLESAIRVIDELTADNTRLRQENNLALDVLQETEQLGAENLRLRESLNALERARERDALKFSALDVELDSLKQRLQQVEAERDAARGIVRTNVAIFEGNNAK